LLTQQQRTVAEVATMVGFENSSSFARAFLQFTGETPSNFRRHSLDSQRLGAISAGSRPAVPAR
jgi:AraC-like DNA-binding protein